MKKKDVKENLTVQIRTMELGTPTLVQVQNFAEVVLDPSQINVSEDASIATNVKFHHQFILRQVRHIVLFFLHLQQIITKHGLQEWVIQPLILKALPDSESVVISQQYIGGSLFKSQNGSIWTPSQFEDMKIKLYKANSPRQTGTAFFYNPSIDYESDQVPTLTSNGVKSYTS